MSCRQLILSGIVSAMLIGTSVGIHVATAQERVDLPSFSEEDPPSLCPPGYVVKGIRCSGGRCDNKSLRCQRYRSRGARHYWSDWFSEERPSMMASDRGFMAGLACSGGWCDNLRIRFVEDPGLGTPRDCRWTDWFSEEQGYRECPSGRLVTGLGCRGGYCDDIRLYCCRAR
jgi:hypothetical protein